jgi:undecaprenyl-diphosphatase
VSEDARPPGNHHRPYRRLAIGVVAATVVIVACWAMVNRPDIITAEEQAFRIVNNAPDALWPVLWAVMQLGNLAAPIVVAGLAALRRRGWRPVAAVLVAGYGAWGAAQTIKNLVARGRPSVLLHDVVLRESAEGMGFVSGHTAIATAMVTVAWPYLGWRGRAVAVTLDAMVALGRLYAGAHLPLDVIGGAAIGVLVGLATSGILGLPRPGPVALDAPSARSSPR